MDRNEGNLSLFIKGNIAQEIKNEKEIINLDREISQSNTFFVNKYI